MTLKLQMGYNFLKHWFTSFGQKGHGIHSPFVFKFIKLLSQPIANNEVKEIEKLRKKLKSDKTTIQITDLGAGSTFAKANTRTISSIAKHSAKPKKYAQLLYKIIKTHQPETIVELGSSLGITTSYLAVAGGSKAKIFTLEGSPEVAKIAMQNFAALQLTNIKLVLGNFDDTLANVLQECKKIDFVFIDGNHKQEPTERYFKQILPYIHNNSILVFDDIHWSNEMQMAWHNIQNHSQVTCSIDLFFIGIVFFRQEIKTKQHFSIRY